MDIYREDVLDHYKNPRNYGDMDDYDLLGRDANASCGDMIEFRLKIQSKKGKSIIEEVKWKGIGCAISTAAASKLSEWVKGRTLDEVREIGEGELVEIIDIKVSPGREKCVTLPIRVVREKLG